MNKTAGTLRQLFDRLVGQQRAWYTDPQQGKPSRDAQEVWECLIGSMSPIGDTQFERWFPHSSDELHVDFSQQRTVLYLPPLEKDAEFVPVLDVKCDVDDTRTEIELRVLLIRHTKDHEQNDQKRLCCIGFRLESPHGDGEQEETEEGGNREDARHGFYHAQLIRDFGWWGSSVESPDWLPCTQPSLPLVANCPVTLVICLLLALYGKRYCWEFLRRDTGLFDWLKEYVNMIQPWVKWRALG